ncbi:MAG: galactose-1-phosphate uridylyltransferase [Candidatus Microsyncoccus archaeolyticus]|nr:MAG: galactose-1-phosphate uridylyltransferase [Candidatus Parcubacteria bacterium]
MNKKTELRYNLLTHDWVIVAPKRRLKSSKTESCPFCDIKDRKPVLIYNNGKKVKDLKEWTTAVIPNKYPVFDSKEKIKEKKENEFYLKITSGGFHEIVITREHNKPMAKLSKERIKEVLTCYKERYLELKKYDFNKYILVFHNHGKEAGASQKHPHSQILTSPLIDKEFNILLDKSKEYFLNNKYCLQCKINEIEIKNKKRIVFENNDFIVFCPFAPKFLFQLIVSPKKHSAFFEEITDNQLKSLAEVFKEILLRYNSVLTNPPYNFYLHTSPCKDNSCNKYFHWYFNFFPRISKLAGFEMGANMEILTITPEEQASLLRNKKHA